MLVKKIVKFFKVIGFILSVILLLFFALVYYPLGKIELPLQKENYLLIKNVSVIDVENDSILKNHHVLIKGKRIHKISNKDILITNKNTKFIDGSDKFLMSGLWDMHTHIMKRSPYVAYPEFISNGVTHVRDMRGAHNGSDPFAGVQKKLTLWNKEVEEGQYIGPKLHGFSSFAVNGPSSMYDNSPDFYNCMTPEDAIKLVKHFVENKVTMIKIYDNIPVESFFALAKEAKKAGLSIAGHKPVRVSTIDASNAGMKSMEHGRFFIWDSFNGAEDLRNSDNPKSRDNTSLRKMMLEQHDSIMLMNMFTAFVKNKTYYCPTHLTRKADAYAEDDEFREKYEHINPIFRFLSFEDLDNTLNEDTTKLGRKVYKDFYVKGLEVSRLASNNGVKIIAGSDVPELPGSSLHDELIELSNAGLSNFEILRTASLYPAQYYELDNLYGSVKEGKVADLIILSKNPLLDIQNSNSIFGVINDGKHLNATYLGTIKKKIENRRKSMNMRAKLVWDMLIYMTM